METKKEGAVKGNYVSIHSSGFRDFLLKPEILRAIVDCGFEHPSEVQHECIPQVIILISLFSSKFYFIFILQAVLGMDILCQAKSGMGKTAVFVLATLQQIEPVDGQVGCSNTFSFLDKARFVTKLSLKVSVLVMCHTRELAFQISKEYERFSKFLSNIKVGI